LFLVKRLTANNHHVVEPRIAIPIERKDIGMPVSAQGAELSVLSTELPRYKLGAARQTLVRAHQVIPNLFSDVYRGSHHRQYLRIERVQHRLNTLGSPFAMWRRFH